MPQSVCELPVHFTHERAAHVRFLHTIRGASSNNELIICKVNIPQWPNCDLVVERAHSVGYCCGQLLNFECVALDR